MCGRYTLGREPESLLDYFHIHGDVPVYHLSYNIAPTQMAPVVMQSGEERVCRLMRWGLIPNWSKGPDARFTMINAKAETIAEKPAYKRPFKRQRCLVPCDGFYEWKPIGKVKQPYYIHKADQGLFALAGIWDRWDAGDESIESFSIITTAANALMQNLHERMPAIIEPAMFDSWLSAANDDTALLKELLHPYKPTDLVMHAVSRDVNSPKHDSADLIKPAEPAQ
jgi:putative SOS response-associated peptidase YedK